MTAVSSQTAEGPDTLALSSLTQRDRRRSRSLKGRTEPRIWTPPLRKLTPKTTKGYELIRFAKAAGVQLMPWQKWLFVHALELMPNGTFRFRTVLVLVSRQNGKTAAVKVLTLWRLLQDGALMALGTSTNMEYARLAWQAAVDLAEGHDADLLEADQDADGLWVAKVKYGALDTSMTMANGALYKIASASRKGGRSMSVDLGIADELREHRPEGERDGWEAWAALSGTTTARPDPQLWALSNAGDRQSVVLNHHREQALSYIDTGMGDERLGLFEWSAPDGCALDDRRAWEQANPALGFTITEDTLVSKSKLPAAVFRTEHLCQGVPALDGVVKRERWATCADPAGTMDDLRSRVAACVEVSEDLEHVTLCAAAQLDDGRVRVEVVAAWSSPQEARTGTDSKPSLSAVLTKVRPRSLGWFPAGPAAVFATDMAKRAKRRRPKVHDLTGGDVTAACMGFAEQVQAGRILHGDDPLLTAHVLAAGKLQTGDGWRFVRRGAGHVDAGYAGAGAVHLAKLIPRRVRRGIITAGSDSDTKKI